VQQTNKPTNQFKQSDTISTETIMQEIRAGILATQSQQTGKPPIVSVTGNRFPPEFYEHLYQAGMTYDQIAPKLLVTENKLPIVGNWTQKIRTNIHQLVLFYVNKLASNQTDINKTLVSSLNTISQTLEEHQ
jgi:hypothetical protein